ncbi:MAG: DUF3089 domain-containing protein, partial [Oxalobacteraceae bacterium]
MHLSRNMFFRCSLPAPVRLIIRRVGGCFLRKQLVAAYLVGCQARPDEYQHLPALRDSLQTGGIIAWNTAQRGTDYPPYHGLLATNPLTWTLDTTNTPAALNRAGVPLNFKRLDPHLTAAQSQNGILWVDDP